MRIFSHNARNNDRVTGMFDRYLGQNLGENDADDALQQLSSRWVFDDSNRRDHQRVRAVESTRAAHKVAILRRLGAAHKGDDCFYMQVEDVCVELRDSKKRAIKEVRKKERVKLEPGMSIKFHDAGELRVLRNVNAHA